jgi:hypothetical protein
MGSSPIPGAPIILFDLSEPMLEVVDNKEGYSKSLVYSIG